MTRSVLRMMLIVAGYCTTGLRSIAQEDHIQTETCFTSGL